MDAAIRPNVVVLKSLGKNFGLHGIRFGYLVANPGLAGTMRRVLPKWNLNSLAETVVFMLAEHGAEYWESLRLLSRDRYAMGVLLARLPEVTVYSSQANFLLVKLSANVDGTELRDYLIAEHQVYIRECGNKLGMSNRFVRLVVRPQQDVARLITGFHGYAQPQWDDELSRRRNATRTA